MECVVITEQEKNRRKEIIDFARGNVRYDGIILSEEVEKINQQYINGEIDSEKHTELCIAQMKLEHELKKKKS